MGAAFGEIAAGALGGVAATGGVEFGEATGIAFGEGPTGGWGEASVVGDEGNDQFISGEEHPVGHGHRMRLNPDEFRALLHHPMVIDAITQRAQQIRDTANSLVAVSPATRARLGEPAYTFSVQNRPDTTRARARVKPAGLLGMIDDAHNATLLKAMNAYPSDPIPGDIGPGYDDVQTPESEPLQASDRGLLDAAWDQFGSVDEGGTGSGGEGGEG